MDNFYKKPERSKFKLHIMHDSTVVDEKNRRVIHTIDWRLVFDNIFAGFLGETSKHYEYEVEGRAKGVAICHPEDTFDPEIGKKMARAMAESNAYQNASRIMLKRLKAVRNVMKEFEDQALDFAFKSENITVHNREYMDELIHKD